MTRATPGTPPSSAEAAAERFALRLTARLDAAQNELPYDITERLRASRMQALAQRKKAPLTQRAPLPETATPVLPLNGAAALGGWGSEGGTWWRALMAALPITALVVGLVTISHVQDENATHAVAQVDTALLTDDLPPSAYTDPGFVQYLKTSAAESH